MGVIHDEETNRYGGGQYPDNGHDECRGCQSLCRRACDSWAYHSVAELAEAGVIQGVDGNYFQGNRSITRYEAAEMVAKAMAHMDRASVEQRAVIHKLADEYAEELNRLGLRVAALENKVGNVKFSGDARFRYRYQNSAGSRAGKENDNSWDYRIRLRGQAQLDERLKAP